MRVSHSGWLISRAREAGVFAGYWEIVLRMGLQFSIPFAEEG